MTHREVGSGLDVSPTDKVPLAGASIRLALPAGAEVAEVRLLTPDRDGSKEFDWAVSGGAGAMKPRELRPFKLLVSPPADKVQS